MCTVDNSKVILSEEFSVVSNNVQCSKTQMNQYSLSMHRSSALLFNRHSMFYGSSGVGNLAKSSDRCRVGTT